MNDLYVVSDLHLDHSNIIDYCDRPFEDVEHMNKELIKNWNNKVNKEDTVLFLGDLSLSSSLRSRGFLDNLNGKKLCIKGNHDCLTIKNGFMENFTINYEGFDFYCCHRPKDIPDSWKGWSLTGHHHNNNLTEHPFIDKTNKVVNCSVELIEYKPIHIEKIINKIKSNNKNIIKL